MKSELYNKGGIVVNDGSWISDYATHHQIKVSPYEIKREINKLPTEDLEKLCETLLDDPKFLETMRMVKLKRLEE